MKTLARVYVNLELSVNEKFVADGIMVKILANLKSPCSNACYLKQKAKPAIEKVWLRQCFGNKIFLSWFDLRNIIKLKKIIVPYAIHFCCVWDTKSLKQNLHIFSKSNYEKRNLLPKQWDKYTLPIAGSSFCINSQPLAQGLFRIAKILTIMPYTTNFSFTNNFKFTYTLANAIISRPEYMNFNCDSYLITISFWLETKGIFQNVAYGTNRTIFTRITLFSKVVGVWMLRYNLQKLPHLEWLAEHLCTAVSVLSEQLSFIFQISLF